MHVYTLRKHREAAQTPCNQSWGLLTHNSDPILSLPGETKILAISEQSLTGVGAQARNFAADWAVERRGDEAGGDEEEGGYSSSLMKSKRSKFTKAVKDEVSTSVNSRKNLIFEGAPPLLPFHWTLSTTERQS